jgi:Holliday junction resolvasome RuvABC DNA-binding subunit
MKFFQISVDITSNSPQDVVSQLNNTVMNLIEALINQGYSKSEAQEEIRDMNQRMHQGEDPEEILYEIGLEPDYVFDLLF